MLILVVCDPADRLVPAFDVNGWKKRNHKQIKGSSKHTHTSFALDDFIKQPVIRSAIPPDVDMVYRLSAEIHDNILLLIVFFSDANAPILKINAVEEIDSICILQEKGHPADIYGLPAILVHITGAMLTRFSFWLPEKTKHQRQPFLQSP